jgi:hypothetical protein
VPIAYITASTFRRAIFRNRALIFEIAMFGLKSGE